MASPFFKRPALGGVATLGSLYDARSDTFLSQALFKEFPLSAVEAKPKNHLDAHISKAVTFHEKLVELGISPEIGASILAGLVPVSDCGLYLIDQRRHLDHFAQSSLHYSITTVEENLNLAASGIKELLLTDVLTTTKATHVVVGVSWGAQFIVTAYAEAPEPGHISRLQHCLDDDLQTLKLAALDTNGIVDPSPNRRQQEDHEIFKGCTLSVFNNALDGEPITPVSAESPTSLVGKLRGRLSATNNGRGNPVQYTLVPLSLLAFCNLVDVHTLSIIRQPNAKYLDFFIQFLDEWADAQQYFNRYAARCERFSTALPPDQVRFIMSQPRLVQSTELSFKSCYRTALQAFRDGKGTEEQLQALLVNAKNHDLSPGSLRAMMNDSKRLEFVENLCHLGATYLGYRSPILSTILLRKSHVDTFVLNFSFSLLHTPEGLETIDLFRELLCGNKNNKSLMLAVDCDAVGQLLDKVYICHYRNGRVVVEDLLEHRKILMSNCAMQYDSDALDRSNTTKPVQRRPVKVSCPNTACDQSLRCQWICASCCSLVEYGHVDDWLYCDCGATPFYRWTFMCQDQRHGTNWSPYDRSTLAQLLDKLKPFDELNILILGETGVGKSTWINAFANYLQFGALQDAIEAEALRCLIPFSFSTQLKDESDASGRFVQKDIRMGISQDEHDGARGQSATQSTNVYTVDIDHTRVRLIDTPGIGDTRGLSQDKKNMADILAVLRKYKTLHGILILLKPNASRLTVTFRFCIKELLTQLHRNAATNIVFGFTNTRGSNYKPGDTFKPLETLLNNYKTVKLGLYEHNVYCFDSESFRYLAARKKGVDMGLFEDNARSWDYSVAECRRLLNYLKGLEPHNVRSTVNLNETRDVIVKLTEPMARIAQKISSSIAANHDAITELRTAELSRDELVKSLYVQRDTVESYEVGQPRTVCTHRRCVEVRSGVQGTNETTVVYKTMCHKPCYLEEIHVKRNTKGHEGLKKCASMGPNGFCNVCNHNYMDHMHIYYDYRSKTYKFQDKTVANDLLKRGTELELKQKAIDIKKKAIEEYKLEYAQVQEATIQFGFFLKRHAIEPYNDATVEYVDHLINQERLKIDSGGRKDALENLEKYKAEHLEKVEALSKAIASGDTDYQLLDDQGVRDQVDRLYSLPHFGEDLQRIVKVNEKAVEASFREKSYNISLGIHWKSQSHNRFDVLGEEDFPSLPRNGNTWGSGRRAAGDTVEQVMEHALEWMTDKVRTFNWPRLIGSASLERRGL
ncbi:hypothetical protein QR685DRAFT_586599 [Neurospora intermedia]|uniref:G domain-containing protein n=1 Tax=Neurospora intermedia TaxID=5142 RepID=A0ABR3DIL1_NEUIN